MPHANTRAAAALPVPRTPSSSDRWLPSLMLAAALVSLAPMAFAQTTSPADTAAATDETAPQASETPAAKPVAETPATSTEAAPAAKPAGAAAMAEAGGKGSAQIMNAKGEAIGSAAIADTAAGTLHVKVEVRDLPPGVHAIHLHAVGTCTAPDFKSAGDHIAGGKEHGAMHPGGAHSGDLPNLTVAADGTSMVEFFAANITLADVTDDDGGAVVIHADPDDYVSQPSGAAGDRIACGVFKTGA